MFQKFTLTAVLLFLGFSATLFAQNNASSPESKVLSDRLEQRRAVVQADYGLTDAQTEQLLQIEQERMNKATALRQLPRPEQGAAFQALETETLAKMEKVLTAEQFAVFKQRRSMD